MNIKDNVVYSSESPRVEITVEERSDVYISPYPDLNEACTYGKIIKLEHQADEKNNGILLATKENGAYKSKAKDQRYPIMSSTDNGKTWNEITRVADELNIDAIPGYQPYLFELPANVGEFNKGTVFLAFASIDGKDYHISITLAFSNDLGKTWKTYQNIDVGGRSKNAIWEPVLAYEEETKRIYCFYSDERDEKHSQKLVYRYTTDLKVWSDVFDCTALENQGARPGMVSLTRMGNGKWALVFELTGINIKFTERLDKWDISDPGRMITDQNGVHSTSGPVIAWSPCPGDKGTLFLTSAYQEGSPTRCNMFVSFDYGESFLSFPNPINVLAHSDEYEFYGGYSAGMYVDKEGTLYYVNNPQNKSTPCQEKLEFVRMKVK